MPEYMPVAQAAELVGVSPRTLKNWTDAGHGPQFIKIGPRNWFVARAAFEAWLASRG